jgi:hypothetical protein
LGDNRDSELDRAREVWRKKFGTAPADAAEKARQMRFLQAGDSGQPGLHARGDPTRADEIGKKRKRETDYSARDTVAKPSRPT